jgi:alpha-methylacyl-CoA racemase
LKGLGLKETDLPGNRDKQSDWPALTAFFTSHFKTKTRAEWEAIFDGTDACCTPVFTHQELEAQGFGQRPAVTLKATPAYAVQDGEANRPAAVGQGIGVEGSGWSEKGLVPGEGGEETLAQWLGWRRGGQYEVEGGGLVLRDSAKL